MLLIIIIVIHFWLHEEIRIIVGVTSFFNKISIEHCPFLVHVCWSKFGFYLVKTWLIFAKKLKIYYNVFMKMKL